MKLFTMLSLSWFTCRRWMDWSKIGSLWNHKLGLRNRRCGWGRSCNRWGDSRRKRILESGKDKWIRNWYRNCKITERRLKVHLPNWINQSQVRKSGQRKRTTMETWGVLTISLALAYSAEVKFFAFALGGNEESPLVVSKDSSISDRTTE